MPYDATLIDDSGDDLIYLTRTNAEEGFDLDEYEAYVGSADLPLEFDNGLWNV